MPEFFSEEALLPLSCEKRDLISAAEAELERIRVHEENALAIAIRPTWVYFPWRNLALRIPDESSYFRLRTARNRDLITADEQSSYRAFALGILGLSVGSSVLETVVSTGGSQKLRIADPDTIDITNLNRMRARLADVGENKTLVAARRVWEIDPYAQIQMYEQGVTKENMREFVSGLHAVVDEMDSISLKFVVRDLCRELRIPVIMGTDNGDSAILDVERFDEEPGRPIFHGRVEELRDVNPKTTEEFSVIAAKIIDSELFTERQALSVQRVGKTLAGVPQLGTAASLVGAAVAYAVRRIATKSPIPSGRYVIGLDELFGKPNPS